MRSQKGLLVSVATLLLVIIIVSITTLPTSPTTMLAGAREVPAVRSRASAISTITVAAEITTSGNVDTTGF